MSCKKICRLCDRLVISQAITFDGTSLVINIPAGAYNDGCKYCIAVAQNRPAETTIDAPAVITIGDSTVQYPVTDRCCAQVTACGIQTRRRYAVLVSTSPTSGTFKILGRVCNQSSNLRSIDGTEPTAGGGAT